MPTTLQTMSAAVLTTTAAAIAFNADASDFEMTLDAEANDWRVVVDGVMGGRSTGSIRSLDGGSILFAGNLSLENNGGFSQIRTPVSGDFAGADGFEISVRGDGRRYIFDVRAANARVMAGSFQQTFDTEPNERTTVRMAFDEFRLHSFGRRVPGAPALAPSLIESIGVTLADKKEGSFRLVIDSIRTYSGRTTEASRPDLAAVSRASALDTLRELTAGAAASGSSDRAADDTSLAVRSRNSGIETLRKLVEQTDRERQETTFSPTRSAEAARLCALAIERGVPLFNAGQTAACAAIYEVTIEAMIALGSDDLGRSVVKRLEQGLAEAKSDDSWGERAWTYRRALDDVYPHLARQGARPMSTVAR